MSNLNYVSKTNPCKHCGKSDWCYEFKDGAGVCNRNAIATGYIDSGKRDKRGQPILFPESWNGKRPKPEEVSRTEWFYFDRADNPCVKVSRVNYSDGSKRYYQNYWDGENFSLKKRPQSIAREDIPLYRYQEIKEAVENGKVIFITEGEKCVDALVALGFEATTNIQGCKAFSASDCEDWLKDADVVLVPDRDKGGVELMQKWAKLLPKAEYLYPYPEKDWAKVPPDNGIDIADWISERKITPEQIATAVGVLPESLKQSITPTPTIVPRPHIPETMRVYGGSKDLKTLELIDFVENWIAQDLEFDELRSDVLLKGEKLRLGSDCKIWFARNYGETASQEDIYNTIVNFAKERSFNPVERYLKSCAEKPQRIRIDNLAERYFGRPEPIYNRMVEMWLISAVARAVNKGTDDNPGTQVDHTLILQSSQGKYKSTWFKVLGGKWFTDSVKDIESKDSLMIVHSNWIIELSELDRITSKKAAGILKHWLTQKTDSFRKPYAREVEPCLPRPCVFCGTVNPAKFLVDEENRRFWIVPVSESISEIDINLIAQERDAIWASAYDAYMKGQQWWPNDEEKAQISELNQEFKERDAWHDEIAAYIEDKEYTYSYQILTDLFKIEPGNIRRTEDMRVTKILSELGWTKESRKEIPDEYGVKKYRRVRFNPKLYINGRVGKVGKNTDISTFQDYHPNYQPSEGLVNDNGNSTLPTNHPIDTYLTNPQSHTGSEVCQLTNHYQQLSNRTPNSEENYHVLTWDEMMASIKQSISELAWDKERSRKWLSVEFGKCTIKSLSDKEVIEVEARLKRLVNEKGLVGKQKATT